MQSIFGTDGIRGIFDKEINYDLAYRIGKALGLILEKNDPVIIGRDTRNSGEIILEAISRGIQESGKEFINIGICPTPAIPFLIKQAKFSGGIMISASHNPPEYNGIKLFNKKGKKISKDFETKIEAILMESSNMKTVQPKEIFIKTNKNLIDVYIHSLIKTMGGDNLSEMNIILDTCHGSATTCAEKVFNILGANVKVINKDINGHKINVNCGSTYLEPIKKAVIENNADMGFSFDGDADRVIGVDSKGNVLDGDHILFLWGRELMEQRLLTNNLLISTEMANLGFENAWNEIGGELFRTPVGDKFIIEAMEKKNSILGGEQSGHILSQMNSFSGDGIFTAIQISKLCKKKKISLKNWLETSFYPYPQKLTNIYLNFNIKRINKTKKILFDKTIESYTKNYDDLRIYIRPSGTEPLLRILVEAKSQEKVNKFSKEITNKLSTEMDNISKFL